ncbi:unnamed protein product [Tilletia controversa]|nr:hypothetical protein CF336_g6156 [Tilletia laevis]CAD6982919.1 unnamed protein product [Tilletia controversa]
MNSSGAGPGNIGSSSNAAAAPATTTAAVSATNSRQPTSLRFNLTANEVSPSNDEADSAAAVTMAEAFAGAAAAATSSECTSDLVDRTRSGQRGGTTATAPSYLGKRRRKRSSQHSSPRTSPSPERQASTGTHSHHTSTALEEGNGELGRYALLSSNLARTQTRSQQHAASSSRTNSSTSSSAHATSYSAQEPRSPMTPTSAATRTARNRISTLQPRPSASQHSDVRTPPHSSTSGPNSDGTTSDDIESSAEAPELRLRVHGAVAAAEDVVARPPRGRALPVRGGSERAVERKGSSSKSGPAARLIRSILGSTPKEASAPEDPENPASAQQASADARQPFMLQPVPPARKRRKIVKGKTDLSGDQRQGAETALKDPDTADHDVEMASTSSLNLPLLEADTLEGGELSQTRAIADDSEAMQEVTLSVGPAPTLRRCAAAQEPGVASDLSIRPSTQGGSPLGQDERQQVCRQVETSLPTPQLPVAMHGHSGGHSNVVTTSPFLTRPASEIRRIHRLDIRRALSLPNLSAWKTLEIWKQARHSHSPPNFSKGVAVPPANLAIVTSCRGGPLHPDVQMKNVAASPADTAASSATAVSPTEISSSAATGPHLATESGHPAAHVSTQWTSVVPTHVGAEFNIVQPSFYPSITKQTLNELNLSEMLGNPQLRHDVVFDPHVQFRPNFEGERGRKVRESADQYWAAVAREIANGCTCLRFENGQLMPCVCPPTMLRSSPLSPATTMATEGPYISWPARIPFLIDALRDILDSILPSASAFTPQMSSSLQMRSHTSTSGANSNANASQARAGPSSLASGFSGFPTVAHPNANSMSHERMISHHALVLQLLDPAQITQEMKHGMLNLEGLIRFLAKVLKLHCAPMRDELVERMVAAVCNQGDVVRGLRMCFEILELMKLDIANHQLRTKRPELVETAVDFEVRWFRSQVAQGTLTLERTSRWFTLARRLTKEKLSAKVNVDAAMSRKEFISRAFNEGFLQLLFEAPVALPFAELVAIRKAGMASGIAPSSSSLNQAYTACYPETFQFDAYRLITFHNDITDLSVVYMFLLLFRQLACSPLEAAADFGKGKETTPNTTRQASPAAIRAQAALLASNELENMKNRIWCLLNEANAKVGAQSKFGGISPRVSVRSNGQAGAGANGRASAGLVFGSIKFENATWREGVKDVLLQVAAQATAVQKAAQHAAHVMACGQGKAKEDSEMELLKDDVVMDEADVDGGQQYNSAANPPSERVLAMLNSWMDTNLRVNSPLHKLCQSRLREVVLAILVDRLAGSPPASMATAVAAAEAAVRRKEEAKERALKISTAGAVAAAAAAAAASAPAASTSASGVRRAGQIGHEEECGHPSKKLKVDHSNSASTLTGSANSPTSSSSTLPSPTDSPAPSTAGSASSRHSLAQQQAISLHRLLYAQQQQQQQQQQGGCSGTTSPFSSTPPTPLTPASSIPMTPLPRSPLWTTSTPEERDWPSALTRSGLEPFSAEVRLLGDRISTLAAFHLRVFRNLYERLDLSDLASATV